MRPLRRVIGVLVLALAILAANASNPVGYIVRAGWYQAELLWGRVPIHQAITAGHFDEKQLATLSLIPKIKAFGKDIGLSSTENYETINPTWHRTIWNLSACEPLSFSPRTWWFPIVGQMPYLGFFTVDDALDRRRELQSLRYDVYLRTAGAYSTLGWFEDPVLPGMLKWSEYALSNTILHELAHATVWIPGSVQFNESFANFVGDVASLKYLSASYGPDSDELRGTRNALEDWERYTTLQRDLYAELDAIYTDPNLDPGRKRVRKHALFAALPTRFAAAGFHDSHRFLATARSGDWNNARMMQFRTYNRSREWFEALLAQEEGNLLAFMQRVDTITQSDLDPYEALARAVGHTPEH